MSVIEKRMAAAKAGRTTYESAPCRVCGTSERYVSNAVCVQCARNRATQTRAAIRDIRMQARARKEAP